MLVPRCQNSHSVEELRRLVLAQEGRILCAIIKHQLAQAVKPAGTANPVEAQRQRGLQIDGSEASVSLQPNRDVFVNFPPRLHFPSKKSSWRFQEPCDG